MPGSNFDWIHFTISDPHEYQREPNRGSLGVVKSSALRTEPHLLHSSHSYNVQNQAPSIVYMAEPSSLRRQVSETVNCPICLEELKDPRSLPCLHSFCFQCLQGLYEDKNPGDDVSCPVCRKRFQIPQGGLNSLPLNFFLQNLIEAINVKSNQTGTLCGDHPDKTP